MTYMARVKTVIEALMGKPVPVVTRTRIVDRVLATNGTDTTDMDNETKALAFLNGVKDTIKNYTVSAAITDVQRNNQAAEQTAIDEAENDFL